MPTLIREEKIMEIPKEITNFAEFIEWKEDCGEDLNASTRRELKEFYQKHGGAWLGNVNLYKERKIEDSFKVWDGKEQIYNYEFSFALPQYSKEVYELVIARKNTHYEGTAKDAILVGAIHEKISELGGVYLFWN